MNKLARTIFAALLATAAWTGLAVAQSAPAPPLAFGFVPTAAQWNSYFQAKQDYLGFNVVQGTSPIVAQIVGNAMVISLTGSTAFQQSINVNTATPAPTPLTGTLFQTVQADGIANRIEQASFAAASFFTCRRADGTDASPTALQNGDLICGFNTFGHDGTAWSTTPQAGMDLYAAQTWSVGAHGTRIVWRTTPNGSVTLTDACSLENDGGLTCPPSVTGGTKGPGSLNLSGGLYVLGSPFALANLATVGANTVAANVTNTAGAVLTAFVMPTCTAATCALQYTPGTGFTLNNAISAALATAASTSTIANDTTTNATMFPVWATANTGNLPLKVASTKLTFNPSTGLLASTLLQQGGLPVGTIGALAQGNANLTPIPATARWVYTSATLTAPRTWTLSAASAYPAGQPVYISDLFGGVSGTNTLTIAPAGGDTITGSTVLSAANGGVILISDGVSKWTSQSTGSATAGGVTSVTCNGGLSGGVITTSGTCAIATAGVTNAMLANMAATTVKASIAGGVPVDAPIGAGLAFTGGSLVTTARTRVPSPITLVVQTSGCTTTASPFCQPQDAMNYILTSLDIVCPATPCVTVSVLAGTWNAFSANSPFVGNIQPGSVVFEGDVADPTNVIITSSGSAIGASNNAVFTIRGFRLNSTNQNTISTSYGGKVYLDTIDFSGAVSGFHMNASVNAAIIITGSYTISSDAGAHYSSSVNSIIDMEGPAGMSMNANIIGTTMTVNLVNSGAVAIGQQITGAAPNTYVMAFLTGNGGLGTYRVNKSQTVGFGTLSSPGWVVTTFNGTRQFPSGFALIRYGATVDHKRVTFDTTTNSSPVTSTPPLVAAEYSILHTQGFCSPAGIATFNYFPGTVGTAALANSAPNFAYCD